MAFKKKESQEDNLTQMHRKARKRKRRKALVMTICICVIALAVIIGGVTILRNKVADSASSSDDSGVESAEVTSGSISESISGSGTLTSEDVESIEILSTLEVDTFYVDEGDSVATGDLIATVTSSSLLSAMSSLQTQLDTLDEEIEEASDDEVDDTVTAGVSGRVKKIYVEEDDDVITAMYEYGALILLSLDGYMAVDVETDSLSAGDEVTVTDSDDEEYTGEVEKVEDGVATIIVEDDEIAYGDEVTVTDSDDTTIGTGTMYIHSSLAVTGYAGTVEELEVDVDDEVESGDTLITLTDTETSANYDELLQQREELEDMMDDLITIYKEGGILATIDGVIESLSESDSSSSAMSMGSTETTTSTSSTTVASISPNTSMSITISVDESDILYISEGLEAQVTISSISDDAYSGTVTEISTSATGDSGVTNYTAVVTIDKTDDMLSGMSASVVIIIQGVDDALLIPVDALYQTSSTSYVYTEYDEDTGELSGMVEVTTGLSNSSYVEITDGLSEGDTIYYASSDSSSDELDFSSIMGGDTTMGGSMDMSDFSSGGGTTDLPSSGGGSGSTGGDMAGGGSMPGGN